MKPAGPCIKAANRIASTVTVTSRVPGVAAGCLRSGVPMTWNQWRAKVIAVLISYGSGQITTQRFKGLMRGLEAVARFHENTGWAVARVLLVAA